MCRRHRWSGIRFRFRCSSMDVHAVPPTGRSRKASSVMRSNLVTCIPDFAAVNRARISGFCVWIESSNPHNSGNFPETTCAMLPPQSSEMIMECPLSGETVLTVPSLCVMTIFSMDLLFVMICTLSCQIIVLLGCSAHPQGSACGGTRPIYLRRTRTR